MKHPSGKARRSARPSTIFCRRFSCVQRTSFETPFGAARLHGPPFAAGFRGAAVGGNHLAGSPGASRTAHERAGRLQRPPSFVPPHPAGGTARTAIPGRRTASGTRRQLSTSPSENRWNNCFSTRVAFLGSGNSGECLAPESSDLVLHALASIILLKFLSVFEIGTCPR